MARKSDKTATDEAKAHEHICLFVCWKKTVIDLAKQHAGQELSHIMDSGGRDISCKYALDISMQQSILSKHTITTHCSGWVSRLVSG